MIKNRFHVALVCTTLTLTYLSAHAQIPVLDSIKFIKKTQKIVEKPLRIFARIAVEFLPNFVKQAGGKKEAVQLIIDHKRLEFEILLTSQVLKQMEKNLKTASLIKQASMAIPIEIIKLTIKQKQKKLQKMEDKYPVLKKIGSVRKIIKPFLGEDYGRGSTFLKTFDKLWPKKEIVSTP